MLVITRRPGESFFLNDDIEITMLNFTGRQIRIGIEAPENVTILRSELKEKEE